MKEFPSLSYEKDVILLYFVRDLIFQLLDGILALYVFLKTGVLCG